MEGQTHLKLMIFGCLSFRRCLMSVSFCSRTFLMATSSERNLPRKTAPCAPLPSHCNSEISSNGTSHMSGKRKHSVTLSATNYCTFCSIVLFV